MKQIILLLFIFAITNIKAQDNGITLCFSAEHNNNPAEIDSVLIENLTQGGYMVLPGSENCITFTTTGIEIVDMTENDNFVSQNYPNPFSAKTNFDINVSEEDFFRIEIYDLFGRKVTNYECNLEQGIHSFIFLGGNNQNYILAVSSSKFNQQRLMVQVGSEHFTPQIVYKGIASRAKSKIKPKLIDSEFPFQLGNSLRFTAYVSDDFDNIATDIIEDAPTASKNYVFDITFYFSLILEANPIEGGTVYGSGLYEEGDIVQIQAIANEEWQFIVWTGDTEYVNDAMHDSTAIYMPARIVMLTANFYEENDEFDIVIGKISIVANPCLDDPCLPGLVYAIETDTIDYVMSIDGFWAWDDGEPLIINDVEFHEDDLVKAIGIISIKQDIFLEDYYELEIESIYKLGDGTGSFIDPRDGMFIKP